MQRSPLNRSASSTAPSVIDFDMTEQDPDKINEMYCAVLDHLLTTPQVKEGLLASQSTEKKWQTVKMYKNLFEGNNSNPSGWGDRENMLMNNISRAKKPDLASLSRLKIILSSANRELMTAFLDVGGISVLLRAIESRLNSRPQTEVDIAILYEILSCCKAIMNNDIGMEGFAATHGAIDIVARCLRFEYKVYALLVLEILSVCCYYSDQTTLMVVQGMRQHGRYHLEAPFASLVSALLTHDIELKASIMQFVNSMIMGLNDVNERLLLRADLGAQLFDEKYDESMLTIERELSMLPEVSDELVSTNTKAKLRRQSMVTMYGPKAFDERKVEAMVRNMNASATIVEDSAAGHQIEMKSKNLSIFVNPLAGTMAGLLHAAKNTEKIEAKLLDMVGGKKTKRRWFELDATSLKWCAGHDKEVEYKGSVPISSIIDIRNYSTDNNVLSSSPYVFEIENSDRTYALGCETLEDKANWLTALQKAHDDHILTKGSYKLQSRELAANDVIKFVEMFKKQGAVYSSISIEDRKLQLDAVGLDLTDCGKVLRFLQLDATASGNSSKLLAILFELLLLPSGAQGSWDAVICGLEKLREATSRKKESAEVFEKKSVTDLFSSKATEGGAAYSQVSKLALTVLTHEQEIVSLNGQIKKLQKQLEERPVQSAAPVPDGSNVTANPADRRASQRMSIIQRRSRPQPPKPTKSTEMGAVLSVGEDIEDQSAVPPQPPKPTPAPVQEAVAVPEVSERYAKYDKMRKMLPEGAVRQKMQVDGFTAEEIDAFLAGAPIATAPAPVAPAAPADDRYAKFEKMKRMLPEGAVRQKMMVEGFSEAEIDAFMAGAPIAAAAAAAPPAPPVAAPVDERFAKYDKMRKMLPEGAVRQKMMVEGIPEADIDAFFNGTLNTAAAAPPAPPAPAVVDERFAKFDKMRKMLPEGAVRQKMSLEGFTQAEIDGFFSGAPVAAAGGAPPPPPAPAPVLDERFAKYSKMKTMLPEGAVRQKMTQDGFTPAEIDMLFGVSSAGPAAPGVPRPPPKPAAPAVELPPEGMAPKGKVKPAGKLKGLFWTKLKPEAVKDTVWYKLPDFNLSSKDAQQLEEWFSAKGAESTSAKKPEVKADDSAPKLISVMDGKRTQSVLILLGKLRMGPEDLTQRIRDMDPKQLDQELTASMLEVVPTTEELTAVKAFSDALVLDRASRLVFHLNTIPRLPQRLECHLLGFTWPVNATASSGQVQAIQKAVHELQKDQRLMEKIFSIVLGIGNYINGDTARGQAYGVKLDIFAKIVNLKAALPSQGSLMNFLALIAEQQAPEVATLSEQWMGVWAAAEINFKQLTGDINQLDIQLGKVDQEFTKTQELAPGSPLFRRLDHILRANRPVLADLKSAAKTAESDLDKLMTKYGEQLKGTSEEDPCKKFFSTVADFAKSFRAAIDENVSKRAEYEKAQKMAAEMDAKQEESKSAPKPPPGAKKGPQENLFGRFHDAQKASAGDVLAEFKMRMASKK